MLAVIVAFVLFEPFLLLSVEGKKQGSGYSVIFRIENVTKEKKGVNSE